MRTSQKRTFSKDCIPRNPAAGLLKTSCEVGCRSHIDEVDHQRKSLEVKLASSFHSWIENGATHFLRERISHADDVLIVWNLSDEIGNVDRFGGAGLILQALEALAHFVFVYLDLNLTGEGNVDIEGVGTQSRGSSAVEHDAQSWVSFEGCANGFAQVEFLVERMTIVRHF
jgi:hypothetical protein